MCAWCVCGGVLAVGELARVGEEDATVDIFLWADCLLGIPVSINEVTSCQPQYVGCMSGKCRASIVALQSNIYNGYVAFCRAVGYVGP